MLHLCLLACRGCSAAGVVAGVCGVGGGIIKGEGHGVWDRALSKVRAVLSGQAIIRVEGGPGPWKLRGRGLCRR